MAVLIAVAVVKHVVLWRPRDVSRFYVNGPLKIGHRGAPMAAPENTLASYRKAVEAGLEAIEMDVMVTRDGKIVCSHNHDLERETSGTGYIHRMTYRELQTVDAAVKFPQFSPSRLPLLEEVLNAIPGDRIIDIEIKAIGFDLRAAREVVRIIRKGNLHNRVMVSSFHPLVIGTVRWLDRRIPTAYIWTDRDLVPKVLRKPRFVNLVHPDFFHPEVHLVTRDLIRWARRRGMRVNVWTVNNLPALEWLLRLGVDGLISDLPELMHKAVEHSGEQLS